MSSRSLSGGSPWGSQLASRGLGKKSDRVPEAAPCNHVDWTPTPSAWSASFMCRWSAPWKSNSNQSHLDLVHAMHESSTADVSTICSNLETPRWWHLDLWSVMVPLSKSSEFTRHHPQDRPLLPFVSTLEKMALPRFSNMFKNKYFFSKGRRPGVTNLDSNSNAITLPREKAY